MGNNFEDLKLAARKATKRIDIENLKEKAISISDNDVVGAAKDAAARATETINNRAIDFKDAAIAVKDEYEERRTLLDRMFQESVEEYNDTYTKMNDRGLQLFLERKRSGDLIGLVEIFVNSIANRPASFDTDFEKIREESRTFTDSCEFAERELKAAREAAGNAGAGLAAGTAVVFMAPTAAMWVATTFGTASTGVAISTLGGAAAESAALAWLGGGALAAGGGGIAAGNTLLALAGPIGWGIAGASLLSSIVIYTNKKAKTDADKNEKINELKENTERLKEVDVKIRALLQSTTELREGLKESYVSCLNLYGEDYGSFSDQQKEQLLVLVNATKSLSRLFQETVQ